MFAIEIFRPTDSAFLRSVFSPTDKKILRYLNDLGCFRGWSSVRRRYNSMDDAVHDITNIRRSIRGPFVCRVIHLYDRIPVWIDMNS